MCHVPCAMCHVPCAMCHVPCAMCHVLGFCPYLSPVFLLSSVNDKRTWFRIASVATLFTVILISGCGPREGLAEHGSPKQKASLPLTLLQPSIARIDLGTVERRGHREMTVWLRNNGTKTVEVAEIRTSCECFQVTLEKKSIAPGERIRASLKVDFAEEPSFSGQLNLRAGGIAKAETEMAFVLCVDVIVK
jgi:hypothetical protein